MEMLRARFWEFSPAELAAFRRTDAGNKPLVLGDEMTVSIRGTGSFGVRIIDVAVQSFTIATLRGHPEAGRVTFGAYCNSHNDVVLHIRSRARSSSRLRLLGFLVAGEPMQTSVWCELINRLAADVGDGVIGALTASKKSVQENETDRDGTCPTFIATGG